MIIPSPRFRSAPVRAPIVIPKRFHSVPAIPPYAAARMHPPSAAHPDARFPLPVISASEIPATITGRDPSAQSTPAWLGPFFRLAAACPSLTRLFRPVACGITPWVAPAVREAIRLNSLRIFGRRLTRAEQHLFARRVIGSFYDFVLDVGSASRGSAAGVLMAPVEEVQGLDGYTAARATRRGAILVTAHLGTFEAGLAALAGVEKKISVVFRRDSVAAFEGMRARLHDSLGVTETPIDDGIGSWLALRNALLRDEVVVIQGDRAEPGQKSEVVPFLHGHLRLPTGSVRLAQLTGSPIIPVFALRSPRGGLRVLLKAPIQPDVGASAALRALANAIAHVVAEHPHQWLALEPVFHEDRADAPR